MRQIRDLLLSLGRGVVRGVWAHECVFDGLFLVVFSLFSGIYGVLGVVCLDVEFVPDGLSTVFCQTSGALTC